MIALVPVASSTSSAILETLLAESGNDRRRDTLNRLKAACDVLEAKRQSYKLTDIQRVVENTHGQEAGPKAQSISNERKRPLGMYHYVEARLRELEVKPSTRTVRCGPMETRIATAIDRIDDMDTRSVVLDLQDRVMVAEKSLERAKKLFKTLRPGVDPERLMNGRGLLDTTNSAASPEHIAALQQLVAILTDDGKLSTVGLSFDGRRVRRRGGTRDELVSPSVLSGLKELVARLSVQA